MKKGGGSSKFNMCLLLLTAFIWGIAFVAQSAGGDAVGPYTFNCIRSLIGAIVLLPAIRLLDRMHLTKRAPAAQASATSSAAAKDKVHFAKPAPTDWAQRRQLLIGGVACGTALAVASNLQQMGIYLGSSAGKAGFLTSCYMLIVPVVGLFFHRKCGWNVWAGIVIAVTGLYLLCIHEDFRMQFSDLLLLACAAVFAVHILVIDHFTVLVDGVRMSCIQFFVCGALSAVPMFFVDMGCSFSVESVLAWAAPLRSADAWIPILYAGVLSCGVAYTLQIIGQQGVEPAVASLLMSLESVFSVLAGWVLLGEKLHGKEIFGCVLIFGAVVLAQLPLSGKQ